MQGHCLCGKIAFEIDADRLQLYQCHCSLCRRQGGAAANAATIVAAERFNWVRRDAAIGSWRKTTGFRSDFCMECGAPVPNAVGGPSLVWVPAGLLGGAAALEVVAHLCVASKAEWDTAPLTGRIFDDVPTLEELCALLRVQPSRDSRSPPADGAEPRD